MTDRVTVHHLGIQDYTPIWEAMQAFSLERDEQTPDQIWIVEHPSVYTLGLNGKREHLLHTGTIPVIQTDRGGQVTYHGPGQLVIYPLLDLERLRLNIRELVSLLEQSVITTLAQYGLTAESKPDAPGVYIAQKKIASVGLRIKKGRSYHGLSINNDMDLAPFANINPCGFSGLEMTQLSAYGVKIACLELAQPIVQHLLTDLSANT